MLRVQGGLDPGRCRKVGYERADVAIVDVSSVLGPNHEGIRNANTEFTPVTGYLVVVSNGNGLEKRRFSVVSATTNQGHTAGDQQAGQDNGVGLALDARDATVVVVVVVVVVSEDVPDPDRPDADAQRRHGHAAAGRGPERYGGRARHRCRTRTAFTGQHRSVGDKGYGTAPVAGVAAVCSVPARCRREGGEPRSQFLLQDDARDVPQEALRKDGIVRGKDRPQDF
mmetsp:Transcript_2251/g.4686  ORF Transcript_2251/g.4686 Transcript_2251/m.4686 type:complete len:226 (-) Transcript_2251:308-985(-)